MTILLVIVKKQYLRYILILEGLVNLAPGLKMGMEVEVLVFWSKVGSEFGKLDGTQSNPTTNYDDYPHPISGY